MGEMASWSMSGRSIRRDRLSWPTVSGLAGALATIVALGVGAVLTVLFAATLAVVMALATVLLGLSALVWRMRRPEPQGALIQARKVGHQWVAYGWDRR